MPRQNQLTFLPPARLSHGGDERLGKRKLARPFDSRKPVHLVMRSSRAKGPWSLLKQEARVKRIVTDLAKKNQVSIYRYANAGNHLHLLVQAKSRQGFQSFLRASSGLIARLITGAKKGNPQGKFWDLLAWSRVVQWGREFERVRIMYSETRSSLGA